VIFLNYDALLLKYPYAELRIESGDESYIRIQDDEIKVTSGTHYGISVRVLDAGSWGFASSNRAEDLESLFIKASKLAKLEPGKIKLAEVKPVKKHVKDKIKKTSNEEKIKTLIDAKKEMDGKKIISRKMSCSGAFIKKEFYNSEGAQIIQEIGYSFLACTSAAKEGENILRGSETEGSRTGFNSLDVYKTAKTSAENAERLLGAPTAPRGRFSVVLDPEMSGVFAHEALGHAAEADSVVDRESILSNKIGKKIGNELITIVDDPSAKYFGAYSFDDEGVEAKKTTILEKGILKNFLNSRESAKATKMKPNGHARASGVDDVPIVRMSNTFIERGEHPKDEIFDLKKGIYIKGMRGGSVDIFSGGFMFKAQEAYLIKNGELGQVLRDAAISGNVLKALNRVEAVGSDFGSTPGMCGKSGQDAPVADGGPHIRIKNVMVG
jgi:TldD protein